MAGAIPLPIETTQQTVRTRRVFYVPGFDPMPARRYRELYRLEGGRQAAISGYSLSLSAGRGNGLYAWDVKTEIDGQQTSTRIEFLGWDDLVRHSMEASILSIFGRTAATLWLYLRTGALAALFGMRKGPMITAFYPVFMLLAQLALGSAAGFLVYRLLAPESPLLAWPLAAVALAGVLIVFRRLDGRLYVYYLLGDYFFFASGGGRTPPELDTRLQGFVGQIIAALDSDTNEVLIVGHSSGAQLAVSLAAMVLRRQTGRRARLSLLTLGQVIPMISFLPRAQALRGDLAYLSNHAQLVWADVSAPGDGACFALCDPVQVTGVAPDDAIWPVTISAAFSQTLSARTQRANRWRFFRLHMQYLCAFEHPRDYDYFRITGGPRSLRDLLKTRANSPSRVTAPRSPFRDLAP